MMRQMITFPLHILKLNSTICSSSDSAQLTNEEAKVIEEDLHNIVNDITERLNDQNMISGVKKFIKSYTRMQHSSFAPTATISYALHNFGKPDSKLH